MAKKSKTIDFFENFIQKGNKGNIYCIIDVNLNRAKEGLRVISEVARFFICEEKIFESIKKLRDELDNANKDVYNNLIYARNIDKDIGVQYKEKGRKGIKDLLIANFKRAEESVRVLEEFSKLVSSEAGYKFKKIRFNVYDLEKKVMIQFIEKVEKNVR